MSSVSLVAMPWAAPETPSIQIGLLTAAAINAGVPVAAHSLHLEAAGFFADRGVRLADFEAVCHQWWRVGLGEWIFAGTAKDPSADVTDYLRYLATEQVPQAIIKAALRMRFLAPEFLHHAAGEILASAPCLVGFTTTFAQTVPSLALAARIKACRPEVTIVFGGANCDGPLGDALLDLYDVVDVVVQGQAEATFPYLCSEILAGRMPPNKPGLLVRGPGRVVASITFSSNDSPRPDYDEYYERLGRSSVRGELIPRTRLVLETARGCWWGERQHCTFCGLNGSSMAFKSRAADKVLADITALATKYQRCEFDVVDNILDPTFFDDLLPELAKRRHGGYDYRFFWELKANLTPQQIRLLRDAGVQRIQPGIESLSTRILRRMRKGVSALHNVKLLVFAASDDLLVTWNIIYGIPGETEEDYVRMADMVPSLVHLKPPGLVRLQVQRFSPYFDDPTAHGLRLLGPAAYYRHIHNVAPDRLPALAYVFDHDYDDGHDPERTVAPLRRALEHWDEAWSPGRHHSLRFERGPGYLRLRDRRPGLSSRDILLDTLESELYLACRTVATPAACAEAVKREHDVDLGPDEVRRFLIELTEKRFLLRDGDRYLALALPLSPYTEPPAVTAPRWKLSPAPAQ
jgi:ribosomal peptide maturation radical SAM protein 1